MIVDVEKCLVVHKVDANIVVAKGVKDPKNKLYQFQIRFIKFSTSLFTKKCVEEEGLQTCDAHQSMFWHMRLPHLHY
jgi:hypothetical protein